MLYIDKTQQVLSNCERSLIVVNRTVEALALVVLCLHLSSLLVCLFRFHPKVSDSLECFATKTTLKCF